ncbi:hypothetical protein GQ43DRAFT_437420 [Delitschia confertaspora ATCC 74209]|uniref:Large ribosomal subunit protein mL50 n=1 Tax=Delitschia confertaspora ATCC 74209 TaxID=1513339 RepID=A0A9P4JV55_9PLEO|nr:hypothetical protein GQ43DRAFT_437420 [Delitschia confertaspora ATCC 74209]
MHRLPRSQRPIEQLLPSVLPLRPCLRNSPCRPSLCATATRSNVSPFSTSAPALSIFSSKPDKKKHRAFVRRWQKRLLGESDPVGAHVDPYDKTSPVRIAPEEQGEEEELLEEMEGGEDWGYTQAETWRGLERIGSDKWVQQWKEWENADSWKKWEPSDSYAPVDKVRDQAALKEAFHRAVVEVITLKKAGAPLEFLNDFVGRHYDPLRTHEVKLRASRDGSVSLLYPSETAVTEFLQKFMSEEADETDVGDEHAELVDELLENGTLQDATIKEKLKEAHLTIAEARSLVGVLKSREVVAKVASEVMAEENESAQAAEELKLNSIPLTDLDLKFNLLKRLTALTGLRISDPNILQIDTFADLYHQLLAASKPQPKKLVEEILADPKKAKKVMSIPNVKISPRRVTVVDKEKEVGRWKVIEYALKERGIPVTGRKVTSL